MKYILLLYILIFGTFILSGQDLERIDIHELEQILTDQEDKVHVINFWATWCGPCVTEIPHFQEVAKDYNEENVNFKLISLDFPSQVDSRLIPFLEDNDIQLDVYLMINLDYNAWVTKVDREWKGNLPATIIYNHAEGKRIFIPRVMNEKEIKENIEQIIN